MPKCTYCGSSWSIQQDHVRAKSKGGVATVPACRRCNQSKGAKSQGEWFNWLKQNDSYRWGRIKNNNKRKRSNIAKKVRKVCNK